MVFMLLLPLGLGFFLGLLYLALSPIRRQRVTHKLNALSGSISAGWTPSERWPSEKRKDGREASPSPEYRDAYPPSTRPSLAELVSALPPHQRERCQTIGLKQAKIRNAISPWGIGWEHWSPATCSPMGISLGEIRALGDFPDYAKLSGVPLPQAYPEFDINKARPRPYRPFRWAYHQTMGKCIFARTKTFGEHFLRRPSALTKLEPDWWLELEQTYVARIRERMTLFAENGRAVLDYLPGSELACKELMEMCLQFICARYPHYFSLSQDKQVFYNEILKTETRLKELHPLHVLLRNVPEDFAIMLRNPDDGCYYFRAGVLCSALGWDVSTKIGLALHQIHEPVPDYKEKMRFSMDRYGSVHHHRLRHWSSSVISLSSCIHSSNLFTPTIATSPNSPRTGPSSAAAGASKSIHPSSCHRGTRTSNTAADKTPSSPSPESIYELTGRPYDDCPYPVPSSSISKRSSLPSPNFKTSLMYLISSARFCYKENQIF